VGPQAPFVVSAPGIDVDRLNNRDLGEAETARLDCLLTDRGDRLVTEPSRGREDRALMNVTGDGGGRGRGRRAGLPLTEVALLAAAVVGISSSAPLAAAAAAPALAIAFWRNAMASTVLLAGAAAQKGTRRRSRERSGEPSAAGFDGLGRREIALCALAGVFLAAHFGLWIPSLTMTPVAASTALVCTTPLWSGMIAKARGLPMPWAAWAGMGLAVVGVLVVTSVDVNASPRALLGDALALGGGACMAAYLAVGERVRQRVTTETYTLVCYGTAAVLLLVACLASGAALVGYDARTWAALVALAAAGQLVGHSLLNRSLEVLSGSAVAVITLLEVPGASLLAALWLGQAPSPATWAGVAVIFAGVCLAVRTRDARGARAREGQPAARPGGACALGRQPHGPESGW
jgi:drug/metabolite transporter (DMT)-like permease